MGKSRRAKQTRNGVYANKYTIAHSQAQKLSASLAPEDVIQSDAQPQLEVTPVSTRQVISKPVAQTQHSQPNALHSLLNSILVREYKRLEQQLLDLKRQLEANEAAAQESQSNSTPSEEPKVEADLEQKI